MRKKGCTHCNNINHAVENCFELHGYPDWWDGLYEKMYRERKIKRTSLLTTGITLVSTENGDSDLGRPRN